MIDDLPDAPDPAIDPPKTFSTKAAAMVLAYKNMVVQIRAAIASIGIIASGSANKIPYRVDLASQVMGDPGAGWLRLNSATQNAATALALDVVGNDMVDYTGLISTFSASTSAVLGQIRIEKQADASKFLVFALATVATSAGYRQLTVTCVSYSAANPFVQGDPVVLSFQRTGDKGDTGPANTLPTMRARDQKASSGAPQQATAGIFVTRTLNTSAYNNIPGASLASNQISVGAGTYDVFLRAPAVGGKHQATLWNVTTGAHAILGSSAGNNATADDTSTDSIVMGRVVPSGPTVYEVRHWHQVTGKYLGVATNSGAGEVYTEVIFTKVA